MCFVLFLSQYLNQLWCRNINTQQHYLHNYKDTITDTIKNTIEISITLTLTYLADLVKEVTESLFLIFSFANWEWEFEWKQKYIKRIHDEQVMRNSLWVDKGNKRFIVKV